MKNNKGITLIALVITIIVMLILVTVTIRVATDGNLFTHASNAVKGTKTAIEGENAILNDDLGIEAIVAAQTGEGGGAAGTYTAYTVGQTVTLANQDFYVIEDSDSSTSTVKLLAALNVETDSNSANYNKQNASASTVAFDSTEPYSNVYANSTIKPLVDGYVSSLGVTVQEKRLMLKDEAEALQTGHTDILYATNFWLGSPYDGVARYHSPGAWFVLGDESRLSNDGVNNDCVYGLRPVIVILKSNIPAQ